MNLAREIKKDIYWIGVNDRRTHIFENYWPLPKGVAYNSYIIVDEKVVVIDTIERSKMDDYVENIEQLLNGRKSHETRSHRSHQSFIMPLPGRENHR